MKSFGWIILILSLLVAVSCLAQDDPPNLTGNWILNAGESDDLGAVMRAGGGGGERPAGGQGGGPGGGGGGGGRGGGQGGGPGGGGHGGGKGGGNQGQNEDRQAQAEERRAQQQEEYSRLEIFQDGIELNVTNGLDITRLLFTDGREMTIFTQQGEARAAASWEDNTLVVHWTTGGDQRARTRIYTLSEDGRKLNMTEERHLPGQDKTVKIRMVYDLQK